MISTMYIVVLLVFHLPYILIRHIWIGLLPIFVPKACSNMSVLCILTLFYLRPFAYLLKPLNGLSGHVFFFLRVTGNSENGIKLN